MQSWAPVEVARMSHDLVAYYSDCDSGSDLFYEAMDAITELCEQLEW